MHKTATAVSLWRPQRFRSATRLSLFWDPWLSVPTSRWVWLYQSVFQVTAFSLRLRPLSRLRSFSKTVVLYSIKDAKYSYWAKWYIFQIVINLLAHCEHLAKSPVLAVSPTPNWSNDKPWRLKRIRDSIKVSISSHQDDVIRVIMSSENKWH